MIKITGLDEIQKKLRDIADKAHSLNGQQIPIPSLLTPEFIKDCSRFNAVDEMFKASGFTINSAEDFKAIPDLEWDHFIAENTSYSNWEVMLSSATKIWTKKQLSL